MNATASQVPILGGAYQGEDRGYNGATDIPDNDMTPWNAYNKWLSPVQGTLPPEWADVFPNIEIMWVVHKKEVVPRTLDQQPSDNIAHFQHVWNDEASWLPWMSALTIACLPQTVKLLCSQQA